MPHRFRIHVKTLAAESELKTLFSPLLSLWAGRHDLTLFWGPFRPSRMQHAPHSQFIATKKTVYPIFYLWFRPWVDMVVEVSKAYGIDGMTREAIHHSIHGAFPWILEFLGLI